MSKLGLPFGNDHIMYARAPSDEIERDVSPELSKRDSRILRLLWTCVVLLLVSIGLNGYTFVRWRQDTNLDKLCSTYTSLHGSPVSEGVDITYQTVPFNGSFLKETIYRHPPSPEVDRAWEDLGANYQLIRVPEDRAEDFGLDQGQVKIPEELGGGYPATVETFHHLHCLNLLRQSTWFNYDYYHELGEHAFHNNDKILRLHVGHCIDILRQRIMCTAETTVFGQWWIKDKGPFVDFNTQHTCRNFEEIRSWTEQHLLPAHVEVEIRPGDVILSDVP